jgi:ankyrin repeat protein
MVMTDLLLERGADTTTPHMMAYTGDLNGIKGLLGKGAAVDSLKGFTLLHAAAAGGHTDVIEFLINKGFEITATPEDDNEYFDKLTPLHYAVGGAHPEAVEVLLANGALVNSGKYTPLLTAVDRRHKDMIRFLVSKGADINKGPDTALHNIIDWWEPDKVELLLEAGADPNVRDAQGNTPLHRALSHGGQLETSKLLVSHGADVNVKNKEGSSPLSIAKAIGREDIVEILIQYDARGARRNLDR